MGQENELPMLPVRAEDCHKGSFGKICVIGGSFGMAGAVSLAVRSALRTGAGLVRAAVPESILGMVACMEPCCTTIALAEDGDGRISSEAALQIKKIADDNDIVLFGPGCGVSRGVSTALAVLLEREDIKLVIDADGLNCLAKQGRWYEKLRQPAVITPHPGEMKRLWARVFREAMPENRTETAKIFAERTNCITVLKGKGTVVSDGQRVYINATGNAGMATAGAGDCLGGVIAALLGQGMDEYEAAVLGVYLHGLAGDIAAEKKGQLSMTAMDISECLCEAIMKLQEQQER